MLVFHMALIRSLQNAVSEALDICEEDNEAIPSYRITNRPKIIAALFKMLTYGIKVPGKLRNDATVEWVNSTLYELLSAVPSLQEKIASAVFEGSNYTTQQKCEMALQLLMTSEPLFADAMASLSQSNKFSVMALCKDKEAVTAASTILLPVFEVLSQPLGDELTLKSHPEATQNTAQMTRASDADEDENDDDGGGDQEGVNGDGRDDNVAVFPKVTIAGPIEVQLRRKPRHQKKKKKREKKNRGEKEQRSVASDDTSKGRQLVDGGDTPSSVAHHDGPDAVVADRIVEHGSSTTDVPAHHGGRSREEPLTIQSCDSNCTTANTGSAKVGTSASALRDPVPMKSASRLQSSSSQDIFRFTPPSDEHNLACASVTNAPTGVVMMEEKSSTGTGDGQTSATDELQPVEPNGNDMLEGANRIDESPQREGGEEETKKEMEMETEKEPEKGQQHLSAFNDCGVDAHGDHHLEQGNTETGEDIADHPLQQAFLPAHAAENPLPSTSFNTIVQEMWLHQANTFVPIWQKVQQQQQQHQQQRHQQQQQQPSPQQHDAVVTSSLFASTSSPLELQAPSVHPFANEENTMQVSDALSQQKQGRKQPPSVFGSLLGTRFVFGITEERGLVAMPWNDLDWFYKTKDGTIYILKDELKLPPALKWEGDWEVTKVKGSDDDGWVHFCAGYQTTLPIATKKQRLWTRVAVVNVHNKHILGELTDEEREEILGPQEASEVMSRGRSRENSVRRGDTDDRDESESNVREQQASLDEFTRFLSNLVSLSHVEAETKAVNSSLGKEQHHVALTAVENKAFSATATVAPSSTSSASAEADEKLCSEAQVMSFFYGVSEPNLEAEGSSPPISDEEEHSSACGYDVLERQHSLRRTTSVQVRSNPTSVLGSLSSDPAASARHNDAEFGHDSQQNGEKHIKPQSASDALMSDPALEASYDVVDDSEFDIVNMDEFVQVLPAHLTWSLSTFLDVSVLYHTQEKIPPAAMIAEMASAQGYLCGGCKKPLGPLINTQQHQAGVGSRSCSSKEEARMEGHSASLLAPETLLQMGRNLFSFLGGSKVDAGQAAPGKTRGSESHSAHGSDKSNAESPHAKEGKPRPQEPMRVYGNSDFDGPRPCFLTGKVYCHDCHRGDESVIPSRAIGYCDFNTYPVCITAHHGLGFLALDPLYRLEMFEAVDDAESDDDDGDEEKEEGDGDDDGEEACALATTNSQLTNRPSKKAAISRRPPKWSVAHAEQIRKYLRSWFPVVTRLILEAQEIYRRYHVTPTQLQQIAPMLYDFECVLKSRGAIGVPLSAIMQSMEEILGTGSTPGLRFHLSEFLTNFQQG